MASVLIVENDDGTREGNARLARSLGHKEVAVRSGTEVLDIIMGSGKPFDLIISGFDLPDMSGYGLLQELRKSPKTASIPFLLYADVGRNISEACEKLGAKCVRSPGKLDEAIIEILGH
jgi:two-component system chemotaxis response regulator CheV